MEDKKQLNQHNDYVKKADHEKDTEAIKSDLQNLRSDLTKMDRRNTDRHHRTEQEVTRLMSKFEDMPETLKSLNKTMQSMWGKSNEQDQKIYKINLEQESQRETLSGHSEKLKVVDDLEKRKIKDVKDIIVQLIILVGVLGSAALGASHLWM